MIELRHLCKSYDQGQNYVVDDVSFTVQSGETLVIVGSSGCGKTTTLKMINRLVEPSSGDVIIDNIHHRDINKVKLRRAIGYAFQGVGLFPHMNVAENIAIVLRLKGIGKQQREQRAHELLEFVNLDPQHFAQRLPEELSGGQQQRVGVARALANKPKYLLMDEPFGALDAINRDSLQHDFLLLQQRLQLTIIFVTHDVFEALRLADRIAIMDRGKLIQLGSPDAIINQPANEFVEALFAKPAQQAATYDQIKDE